jgi:AcrR family transcriptional regulator
MAARTKARRIDRRTRAARAEGRAAREDLLDAAVRVFGRKGYREAGVEEIADEAGYSKGAIYWHFGSKEDLLTALLDERIDPPVRERVALLETAPVEQDMSVEGSQEFARRIGDRDALLLDREYWSLAMRDAKLRRRYLKRQTTQRETLAAALEARARHLGTPELTMSSEDVARIVMAIVGGLAVDELVEPGSVRPDLVGDALAVVYAGLVARAIQTE